MSEISPMSVDRLRDFLAAWNNGDVDSIMSFFVDDCTFHSSAGSELLGATYQGPARIRKAVSAFVQRFPDAHFTESSISVGGDYGFATYTFTGTDTDGTALEYSGCDIYTFVGDLISVKSGYRKIKA